MSAFIILVPRNNSHGIAAGSGITAKATEGRKTFQIDYEGNLYGACNLNSYWERLAHAAGRGATNYPTGARLWLEEDQMLEDFDIAGRFDYESLRGNRRDRYPATMEEASKNCADIKPEMTDKLKAWANATPA